MYLRIQTVTVPEGIVTTTIAIACHVRHKAKVYLSELIESIEDKIPKSFYKTVNFTTLSSFLLFFQEYGQHKN